MKLLLCAVLSLAAVLHAALPDATERHTIIPVTKRMEETIVPRIEYREASVPEIITHLNKVSKDLDPNKIGVQFELSPGAKASETKITLSLSKVPLMEVVKYVTNLANLKYEVAATKVMIRRVDEK